MRREKQEPAVAPEPVSEDIGGRLRAAEEWIGYLEGERAKLSDRLLHVSEVLATLSGLPDRIDTLTLAVAEGISHVSRAESRVRTVVQRARQELADNGRVSAGVEAEASDLRLIDGGGGEREGVQAVRTDVATAQPTRAEQIRERLKALKLSS